MEAVERMERDCLPHWKCPRSESDVRFVIFLACEVGGSKFIENSREQVQINIARSNVRMYENVFPWLQVLAVAPPSSSASLSMPCHALPTVALAWQEKQIPFIFTSTYLHSQVRPWTESHGGFGLSRHHCDAICSTVFATRKPTPGRTRRDSRACAYMIFCGA